MSTNDTSAPLDIDAIEARHREAAERTGAMPPVWRSASDVPELVAEVRRLRGQLAACVDALGVVVPLDATAADAIVDEHQRATGETRALRLARDAAEEDVRRLRASLDAAAQAFDDLVARVWAATGETHEPPADVEALVARVAGLRESHRERSEALLTMTRRALDAERLLDSAEGTEREEELARQIRAAARREGAEAMRESCVLSAARRAETLDAAAGDDPDTDDPEVAYRYGRFVEAVELSAALRALPPPEVDDASPRVAAAYRAGAKAMRDALVSALDAMVHAEATEAELFRLTRDEDSAAEHHHKRAVLLEARVAALSLPLPEVTP